MKTEFVFALENAGWPAFLVDEAGTIRRSNQAAVKAFGAILEGESTLLSAIWSPANEGTAEQFLSRWERSPTATVALKFAGKGGVTMSYQTHVCSLTRNEQKHFVFQLLPQAAGAAPVNSVAAGAENRDLEAGMAQKQEQG